MERTGKSARIRFGKFEDLEDAKVDTSLVRYGLYRRLFYSRSCCWGWSMFSFELYPRLMVVRGNEKIPQSVVDDGIVFAIVRFRSLLT